MSMICHVTYMRELNGMLHECMSSHAVAILALALAQLDSTLSCCMFKHVLGLCLLHERGGGGC